VNPAIVLTVIVILVIIFGTALVMVNA